MANKSEYIGHAYCCDCKSEDNLALYQDGSGFCFSTLPNGKQCGYKKDVSKMEEQPTGQESYIFHDKARFIPLKTRGITKETCEAYRVTYADRKLFFPIYHQGVYTACKYRTPDKRFGWVESCSSSKLFGLNTIMSRKKTVIITEGEIDALSAHQMYGLKHNVLSITSGAAGAFKDLSTHMEYLNQFEIIYLCFDNDSSGQAAASKCLDLFDPGRAAVVELPPQYKDANEMLLAKADQEFRNSVDKAVPSMPKGMLTSQEQVRGTIDYLINPKNRKGVPTGFTELDHLIGGLHRGEVVTVVGGTGTGKTRFVLDLAYNISVEAENPVTSYFIPLEMPYQHVMGLCLERHIGNPIISEPESPDVPDFDDPQVIEHIERASDEISEHLKIYNHIGGLSLESLEVIIKAAARSEGAQVVFIDHKDQACSGMGSNDYRSIDVFMAKMQELAIMLHITIVVVSQQSRDAGDKEDVKVSLNKIRGSQGVAQNSSVVIGLERPRDSNYLTVKTLKAHRLLGRYGEFSLYRDTKKFKFVELGKNIHARQEEEEYEYEYEEEGQAEVPEPVRSEHTQPEPGAAPDIRAGGDNVRVEVHTGLSPGDKDRKTHIDRSKGVVKTRRQNKADKSEEKQPWDRLTPPLHELMQLLDQTEKLHELQRMGD